MGSREPQEQTGGESPVCYPERGCSSSNARTRTLFEDDAQTQTLCRPNFDSSGYGVPVEFQIVLLDAMGGNVIGTTNWYSAVKQ